MKTDIGKSKCIELKFSAVATGLEKVSFHSNCKEGQFQTLQITMQLYPFCCILARLCSKSLKVDFSNTWTENFCMYNLASKRQRDQRSKCQHSLDNGESKGIPEKHILLFHWLYKCFNCVDYNKLWEILKEMGVPDHLTSLLRYLYLPLSWKKVKSKGLLLRVKEESEKDSLKLNIQKLISWHPVPSLHGEYW